MIPQIRPAQLAAWFKTVASDKSPVLLDVREPHELVTASVKAGNNSTSSVYGPWTADQSDSQSVIDSEVQNDHNTQMNQNVAYALAEFRAIRRQVHTGWPSERLRPYLIS